MSLVRLLQVRHARREAVPRDHRVLYPGTFHFYEQAAYVGAAAIVEALKKAGPKVTRTAFLTQLRGMRAFDIGLGLNLDFSNLKGLDAQRADAAGG
jgi:hypothetical protein